MYGLNCGTNSETKEEQSKEYKWSFMELAMSNSMPVIIQCRYLWFACRDITLLSKPSLSHHKKRLFRFYTNVTSCLPYDLSETDRNAFHCYRPGRYHPNIPYSPLLPYSTLPFSCYGMDHGHGCWWYVGGALLTTSLNGFFMIIKALVLLVLSM